MKKLIMIAAVAIGVFSANAAVVNWKVAGTAATDGYTVYLLTSLADSYESIDALAAASVDSASIAKNGRNYTTGDQAAQADSITSTAMKDAYYVIVASSTATEYTSYKTDLSAYVYDPDKQESSPGVFASVDAATILSSGTSASFAGSAVPEPTSGLLMLLGMAGLALRRRRA